MKQYLGNIDPMESLFSFMSNWLGISNRAIIAAYYFSAQKQKNILLRLNAEGTFEKDFYQEKFLHKTLQRSIAKNTYQSENASSFHNLFVEKFFENKDVDKNDPILVFPFVNAEDGKKDLLFVQLPPADNNPQKGAAKQMSLSFSQNTALIDEITVVSRLIYNMQTDYLEQFISFKDLYNQKCAELDSAKEEIEQIKEHVNRERLQLAKAELDLMASKYSVDYILENSANRKIIETEVDIDKFKTALRKAYMNALAISGGEEKIRINGENLYFEAPSGFKKSKIEESVKMKKVEKYLNELEESAVAVLKEEGRLTAENIGRKFDPIRIPAAISDYNKRHKDRICMLMINRPEEWPTIREFRPIINILSGTNSSEESKTLLDQYQ